MYLETQEWLIAAIALATIIGGSVAMYYENHYLNLELAHEKLVTEYNELVDEHNDQLDSIDNGPLYWSVMPPTKSMVRSLDRYDVVNAEEITLFYNLTFEMAQLIAKEHNACIDYGFDLNDINVRPPASGADAAYETLPFAVP